MLIGEPRRDIDCEFILIGMCPKCGARLNTIKRKFIRKERAYLVCSRPDCYFQKRIRDAGGRYETN